MITTFAIITESEERQMGAGQEGKRWFCGTQVAGDIS